MSFTYCRCTNGYHRANCVCVPYQCGQVTVHSPCDAISTIKHERSDEVIFATERNKTKKTRWVVSKIFLCSSLFGKDSNFDDFCFQMGLKPPTREEDLAWNFDLVFGIVPAMLCKPAFFCGCHGLLHLIFANQENKSSSYMPMRIMKP